MRVTALSTLAMILMPITADAGACRSINWQSFGQITCTKIKLETGYAFNVRYSPGALSIVIAREERKNLIRALCDEGASRVKEISGKSEYTHECKK